LRLIEEEVGLSEYKHHQADRQQGAQYDEQPGALVLVTLVLVTPNRLAPGAHKDGAGGFGGWQGGH
jgi:hypothetical protein